MDSLALQKLCFDFIVKKSNAVIYVVNVFTQFEASMIRKLTELLRQKTLIIAYNLPINSEYEIELFVSNTVSKFFELTKRGPREYFIQNTQVYHLFTVHQKSSMQLHYQNQSFQGQTTNLINKIVITKQNKITLFSLLNEYFIDNKEQYFEDLDNENLSLRLIKSSSSSSSLSSPCIELSKKFELILKESDFNLLPSLQNQDIIYQKNNDENYFYLIRKENNEVQLVVIFYHKIENVTCNLNLTIYPGVVQITFTEDNKEKDIQIVMKNYDNLTNKDQRIVLLNFGVEAYFKLL